MADDTATLVENLRRHLQRASAQPVELIETHISWVLLADATAYKINDRFPQGDAPGRRSKGPS